MTSPLDARSGTNAVRRTLLYTTHLTVGTARAVHGATRQTFGGNRRPRHGVGERSPQADHGPVLLLLPKMMLRWGRVWQVFAPIHLTNGPYLTAAQARMPLYGRLVGLSGKSSHLASLGNHAQARIAFTWQGVLRPLGIPNCGDPREAADGRG